MPTDQEQSEQTERYLAGEMTEPERLHFEALLQQDEALAEAVALERALRTSLGNARRRRLLGALADLTSEDSGPQPASNWFTPLRIAAMAVLLLVIVLGAWLFLRSGDKSAPVNEQPAQEHIAPDSPTQTEPPAPAEKPAETRPIASADPRAFAPNPALDPLAGAMLRGEQADIRITRPEQDAVFPLRNGKINFRLEGAAGTPDALTLRIYNNSEADFAAGKAAFQSEIALKDGSFDFTKTLNLPPGRYYALLSAPGEEEPQLVIRFFAGRKE